MSDIDYLLNRASSITGYEPADPESRVAWQTTTKVLVIGAGGLGCEILKDLALSGFKNIDVIDMDTIDLSNLNRQFLFRRKDIGQPKSVTAANFINSRVKGANVQAHNADITTMPREFYQQFHLVIAGLDSIKARRWINSLLASLVSFNEDGSVDMDTVIPLIDGGTEALQGQARVVLPRMTSCLECSLSLYPTDPLNFQLCTLAHTPRQPEHCIAYILHKWNENEYDEWKGVKLDKDDPVHMTWIFERAKERAEQFRIMGVTFKLTQGVVKRIIPAIAATNAIVSAVCVNEALKIATHGIHLKNYMSYAGNAGVYTNTFEYSVNPECPVCSAVALNIDVDPSETLQDFIERVRADNRFQLTLPSMSVGTGDSFRNLILQGKVGLAATQHNLEKKMSELVQDGVDITITDPVLASGVSLQLIVKFTHAPAQ